MDFTLPYTQEQERFRQEVRAWIEEHVPEGMKEAVDPFGGQSEEVARFARELHSKLAEEGWLHPTYPKEYGGGGLNADHEVIIEEELERRKVPLAYSSGVVLPALLVWGTEEQKQKFLKPLLTGEIICYQGFTEARGGADLAAVETHAVRDGDDWVISGQKAFIGRGRQPDWLYILALTDPEAPRHRNLGAFMIPFPAQGFTRQSMELLTGRESHFYLMDNVRVPGDHLIGGDHQGWQVVNTSLEEEHGGRGQAFPTDDVVDNLVAYTRDSGMPAGNPVALQRTVEAVVDSHRNSLLAKRAYWMYQSRMVVEYEGNMANVHSRESSLRIAARVREVMGLYALLHENDPRAPHQGVQEINQRTRAGQNHAGGSTNIAKVVLARRIGISRTKERPAPTPSTATQYGS